MSDCKGNAENRAYVALYRAVECNRGFLRDTHLNRASAELYKAGLPELARIASDAIGRIGGSDTDLIGMLHALSEGRMA